MTFTEAAEAVLRKAGKALPIKKITQIAIEQNLLSHVGKTPETTMGTRLATLARKDHGEEKIVRVGAGIFALREWGSAGTASPLEAAAEAAGDDPSAHKPRAQRSGREGAHPEPRKEAPRGEGRSEPRSDGRRNDGRRSGPPRNPPAMHANPALEAKAPAERVALVAESPAARSETLSPVETVSTPVETVSTPVETVSAPVETVSTPVETVSTPVETVSTPVETVSTPVETVSTPVETVSTPVETVSTPVETVSTREQAAPEGGLAGSSEEDDEDESPRTEEEIERDERLAASAEMFPEEEDDEEPLLGGAERSEGVRRRRRRRRRGARGPDGAVTEAGAVVEGAVSAEGGAESQGPRAPKAGEEGPRREESRRDEPQRSEARRDEAQRSEPRRDDALRSDTQRSEPRSNDAQRNEPRRDDAQRNEPRRDDALRSEAQRSEPRRDGRRDDGRRDEARRDDGRRDEARRDDGRRDEARREEPRRDDTEDGSREGETGRDAADLLVSMLTRREDKQPVAVRTLVDDSLRAGRLSGDAGVHVAALQAAARVDGARREARGERPRLRLTNGRVGLMDWTLPPELVRAEADALAALERLRDTARRYVVRRLNELPQASFTEMMVLLLERLGISSIRTTRRPGLTQGEVHLAGIARRGPEELRVGVMIKRGGEVGRERVIELRGSAHHYGPATAFWVVTTSNALSGAREEAAQPGVIPVTLIDAQALGRMVDEYDVCVRHASIALPYLDIDLFDQLRGF